MSQFLPPEGTPPPAPESFNAKDAANALVQWFNGQEITREQALRIMSMVEAKIIVDITRKDVFSLSEAVDKSCYQLVNDMNAKLESDHMLRHYKRKPR